MGDAEWALYRVTETSGRGVLAGISDIGDPQISPTRQKYRVRPDIGVVSNTDPIPSQDKAAAQADLDLVAAIRTRAKSLDHHARREMLRELQEYCTAEIPKLDADEIRWRMIARNRFAQPPE
jgi:hypothetical protein